MYHIHVYEGPGSYIIFFCIILSDGAKYAPAARQYNLLPWPCNHETSTTIRYHAPYAAAARYTTVFRARLHIPTISSHCRKLQRVRRVAY
jgi:hypothetical protein